MLRDDGRVIINFINDSIVNKTISIFGDGSQTRSFCFIDDLIIGLRLLMKSNYNLPVNIGSDYEISINKLSELIKRKLIKILNVLNYLRVKMILKKEIQI